MDEINTKATSYLVRRFLPYFKPYLLTLTLDLFCALLTTGCDLVLPMIIRTLTDTAISGVENLTLKLVLSVSALYLALRIIDVFANYYMSNVGHIMGAKIETDMRRDLFSHLQDLSYSYYSETKIGQIMSRITSDLFEVTEFAHHCPEEFFIAGVEIAVAFVVLMTINIPLTVIIFVVIPVMIYFSMKWRTSMRTAFKKQRNQLGEINARVEDSLQGIRVVKSFANERVEEEKFHKDNSSFLDIKREAYRVMSGFTSTTRLFDGIMYIVVVLAGSLFMMKGSITPGDFMAFLMYVVMLIASIRNIVEFMEQFQRGMTGIERFAEVMDVEPEIVDDEDAVEFTDAAGEITFEDVSFHYKDSDENVLERLNLTIKPGEHIALVGPSGAGKTTLCNLIPRFYDVTEGSIAVDGRDIREYTAHSLRSHIGMVQQDVYLFSGTAAENIEYGRPGAPRGEIVRAAMLAGAHEFIEALDEGYDTYVGERGVKLSGGQKQRISIARVFLKNPQILILDEATSALDNESERIVQASLETLAKGRTTLTIAHRLTTIKNADTILVLTENGVEEQGSHAELMERDGLYASLYKLYTDEGSGVAPGD